MRKTTTMPFIYLLLYENNHYWMISLNISLTRLYSKVDDVAGVVSGPNGREAEGKQQCKQQPRHFFHRVLPQWLDNFISENEIIYCMRAYLSNRLETKVYR